MPVCAMRNITLLNVWGWLIVSLTNVLKHFLLHIINDQKPVSSFELSDGGVNSEARPWHESEREALPSLAASAVGSG